MTDGSNINNNLTIVIPETENQQNGKKDLKIYWIEISKINSRNYE